MTDNGDDRPDPQFDYEEWQAQEDERVRADEYYQIFRDSFEAERSENLTSAARSRHHRIILDFRTELDFAKSAFTEAEAARASTGTGWMNLLFAAYMRAYRAVEWYQLELGGAIADAMVQPEVAPISGGDG
jgi:hypothetical protein